MLNGRFLMYEYMENGSLKDHLHCMLFPLLLYLLIPPLLLFLFLILLLASSSSFVGFECALLEVTLSAGVCVWGQV